MRRKVSVSSFVHAGYAGENNVLTSYIRVYLLLDVLDAYAGF